MRPDATSTLLKRVRVCGSVCCSFFFLSSRENVTKKYEQLTNIELFFVKAEALPQILSEGVEVMCLSLSRSLARSCSLSLSLSLGRSRRATGKKESRCGKQALSLLALLLSLLLALLVQKHKY